MSVSVRLFLQYISALRRSRDPVITRRNSQWSFFLVLNSPAAPVSSPALQRLQEEHSLLISSELKQPSPPVARRGTALQWPHRGTKREGLISNG